MNHGIPENSQQMVFEPWDLLPDLDVFRTFEALPGPEGVFWLLDGPEAAAKNCTSFLRSSLPPNFNHPLKSYGLVRNFHIIGIMYGVFNIPVMEFCRVRLVKSIWMSWIVNNDNHRCLQVVPYARLFEDPSGLIPQDPSLSWLDAQLLVWSLNKVRQNCLGSSSQEYGMTFHV